MHLGQFLHSVLGVAKQGAHTIQSAMSSPQPIKGQVLGQAPAAYHQQLKVVVPNPTIDNADPYEGDAYFKAHPKAQTITPSQYPQAHQARVNQLINLYQQMEQTHKTRAVTLPGINSVTGLGGNNLPHNEFYGPAIKNQFDPTASELIIPHQLYKAYRRPH